MLDYIPDDGYSEKGFVKAAPEIHGDFRFEYRPMLPEERAGWLEALGKMAAEKHEARTGAELAKRLKSWSLVDRHGNPVAITATTVLRLKPKLFGRMANIIAGLEASDVDPQWSTAEKQSAVGDEYESALAGTPVGDVRTGRDQKN